jgi:RimJ/RimL family protein N-acetyltransferase
MMSRVVIETERLVLRELEPTDEDALARMFADPEVMRWIGTGGVRTREVATRTIERERERYAERGWGEWATCRRDTGDMIGLCGLILWPDLDGVEELEVAYLLAGSAWGKGYATEAASAIRDFAIRELSRSRLVSLVYHDNVASAAVARKVGMSWEKDVSMTGITVAMYSLRALAQSS